MRRAFACTCPWACVCPSPAAEEASDDAETRAPHPRASFSAESTWFAREMPSAATLTFGVDELCD